MTFRHFLTSHLCWLMLGLPVGHLMAADANPPQPGFNLTESDPKAMAIADTIMTAMGGRPAWDRTRHLTWRFFGNRLHVWDRFSGNHRFENQDLTVLSNLNTGEGRAWQADTEITDPAELAKSITSARRAWINDSYWLIMPTKLKDTGVTLKYVGEKPSPGGAVCDVLQLTFQEVGLTPDNKYHLFVDQKTGLVCHWIYWKNFNDAQSRDLGPWTDWQRHGDFLIAQGHGKRNHTDIAVFEDLAEQVYTDPTPFDLSAYR